MMSLKKTAAAIVLFVLMLSLFSFTAFAEGNPVIELDSTTAQVGEEGVEVNIRFQNNPGISSVRLKVEYDASVLSLTNVSYNTGWGGMSQLPQTMSSPVTLAWFNGGGDYTGSDSVFATLTFDVLDTAAAGDAAITITYNPDDLYNIADKNVPFEVTNGKIKIASASQGTDTPAIKLDSVTANAGDQSVEVPIRFLNNPGIASVKIKVTYNSEAVKLTSIAYNTAWGGMFQQPQTLNSPVTLAWFNGSANYTGKDSVFATLTFDVLDTAAGDTAITVTYDADDLFNIADTNVSFGVTNGKIEIASSSQGTDTPTIKVDSVTANAGDQSVEVPIRFLNNPGIASVKIKVTYNSEAVKLTSIAYNTAWGGMFQQPQTLNSPVTLAWFNGSANYTGKDSVFATLTFDILDTAAGDAAITVTYDADDLFNIADTNVSFSVINGKIEIASSPSVSTPQFKSQSLVLSGQIGVNFFMDLSMLTAEQRSAGYMKFTVGEGAKTQTDAFDETHMSSDGTCYGFTCKVNSIQMADTITAVYHYKDADGAAKTVETTYSVEECLNAYIDYFTDLEDAEGVALVKAINDYGYWAQRYLSDYAKTPWTLGVDHAQMNNNYREVYSYTAVDLADYAMVKELIPEDIAALSYSLTLDTDTAINLYITPAEGYTGTIAAKLNDDTPLNVVKTGGRYKITIPGISAHLLGEMWEVTITTPGGESTVIVSALSYAYACMDESDPANTVMCALYDYYLKAMAFKDAH